MVRSCAARGCTNRDRRQNADEVRLNFHAFPKDLGKLQKWLDAIRREDLTLGRAARGKFSLCSQHFLAEDYKAYGSRRNLHEHAVPSLFPTHTVRRKRYQVPKALWNCAACNCVYNTLTLKMKEDVPLHMFPKDPARRRQWAIAIRREAHDGGLWMPSASMTSTICSLHFPEEDIDRTGQTVRLREGVTPSLFDYGEDGSVSTKRRVGVKRLLSLQELDQILTEQCRLASGEGPLPGDNIQSDGGARDADSPPPPPSSPPSSPPPSDADVRRVTRASLRIRRFSTKQSLLSPGRGKGRSGKTGVSGRDRSNATSRTKRDHLYSQRRPSATSSDEDDPRKTGKALSPLPPPSPPPPPATVPPPLRLPAGKLTHHLLDVKAKQRQIRQQQKTYNALLDKAQYRNAHPDWWSEKNAESAADAPLLALRDGRAEREPPVVPIDSLSADTLLPLTPNDAWQAVASLRQQVLELQVALMYSRIQVKYRELRLQEATAEHRRFKASVREQQRRAEKEEQSRDMRIRQLERRCSLASTHCSQWRLKTRQAEKSGNKKKRRGELLTKGLEEIFTPMQLRVIRSGKKPRWTEEDIRRAIELKKRVTRRGYAFIRTNMKIPLPSPMIMRRGANRFASLKPIYEQMVAANLLKYSTKKKPRIKKEGRSAEQELEVESHATEKEPAAAEAASETPHRAPVKRRKKRRPPSGSFEVEFEALDATERALAAGSAAAPPRKRSRAGWSDARPSWDCGRIWDRQDQPLDEYGQTGEGRRPRHRPAWSADTADFL